MVKDGCRTINSVRGPSMATQLSEEEMTVKDQERKKKKDLSTLSPKFNDCEPRSSLLSVFKQPSWLFGDVSGQPIATVFKGQAIQDLDSFTLEVNADVVPKRPVFKDQATQDLDCFTPEANADVVPKRQLTITNQRCVTSLKSKDINYIAAVAWNLAFFFLNYLICRQISSQTSLPLLNLMTSQQRHSPTNLYRNHVWPGVTSLTKFYRFWGIVNPGGTHKPRV